MSTTTTTSTPPPIQSPEVMSLSEQQRLLKNRAGLDAIPGYEVVVFEKSAQGGATFQKIVGSDERFKKFWFLSSPHNYFGIAINQSVLRYTFEASVVLDDDIRRFTLVFHLTYQAVDSRKLAELHEQDPLKLLGGVIVDAISRSCKTRKWEMVKDRFRELERIVLDGERPRINDYAKSLGLKISSLQLDRRLLEVDKDIEKTRIRTEAEKAKLRIAHDYDLTKGEIDREKELSFARGTAQIDIEKTHLHHSLSSTEEELRREREQRGESDALEHAYDIQRRRLRKELDLQDDLDEHHGRDQRRKLVEARNIAISETLGNVAKHITTADGMLDAFGAVQQIKGELTGEGVAVGTTSALPAMTQLGLPAKEEGLASVLLSALSEIPRWNYPNAQQRALRSAILHVIAEALRDDQADNDVLKQYVDKLNQTASNLEPPLTQTQFRFLETFRNTDSLRRYLG